MSPRDVSRLRRRLTVYLAAALALGIGIAAVVLAIEVRDRRHAEHDDRLLRTVQEARFTTGEDSRARGEVDVEIYGSTPRASGTPVTALLDRRGNLVAGDRDLPAAVRRVATARRRRDAEAPVTVAAPGGDVRLAVLPIEGDDGPIGTTLALEPTGEVTDDVRRAVLLIGGGALAAWLLLTAAGGLLIARALGPAAAAAAREQAFLADTAHELRTPWAIVAARAERALRDGATEEDLRAVVATAAGAGSTITDMLELARLDAGRAITEREPLRLDALVAACSDDVSEAARADGVDVQVRLDGPVVVRGDEALLRRVVANLLDNAVRHGGAGGLVEVAVEGGGQARVIVSDQGPGVPPGQSEHIFDRFHRGSVAAHGGSGLGLPIARLAAEAHGGTLTLEEPGTGKPGARFVLTLPVE